ncbi:transposase [Bradyrhizobium sp. USDA 4011]
MALVDVDERIPQSARSALSILVDQIEDLELHIESYEKMILATAKDNEVCRRLMKVAGIGPFAATALAASVDHPQQFASARHFAAWLGLVPKQHSTGGEERLGGISKRGDGYIRKLLIHGARAAVHRVRIHQVPNTWIRELLDRRPFDSGTTTPPRLGGRDERDSRVDLTTRGTLVPCIKTDIKTGMMPPPISGSR